LLLLLIINCHRFVTVMDLLFLIAVLSPPL